MREGQGGAGARTRSRGVAQAPQPTKALPSHPIPSEALRLQTKSGIPVLGEHQHPPAHQPTRPLAHLSCAFCRSSTSLRASSLPSSSSSKASFTCREWMWQQRVGRGQVAGRQAVAGRVQAGRQRQERSGCYCIAATVLLPCSSNDQKSHSATQTASHQSNAPAPPACRTGATPPPCSARCCRRSTWCAASRRRWG